LFHGVTPIKSSRSSTVIRITLDGIGDCIIKKIPSRSALSPVKNLLRSSTIRKSWMYGQSVHDRWLPTPRPWIMLHRYRGGLPAEGYLITPVITNAVTLHEWIQARPDRLRVVDLAMRLGRLLRLMHTRGVAHRDLKSSNLLIDPEDRPWLIDLVGVTTALRVPGEVRHRDIARLAASFLMRGPVTHTVRRRFLGSYLGPRADWKQAWRSIAKMVQIKVKQNQKRNRVLA
jgi:tRNA A-37 threonylcarbamoyl transferase component Bud32